MMRRQLFRALRANLKFAAKYDADVKGVIRDVEQADIKPRIVLDTQTHPVGYEEIDATGAQRDKYELGG
jgi:hypothetical protein